MTKRLNNCRFDRKFYVQVMHSPDDAEETKAYNTLRTADIVYANWAHEGFTAFVNAHFDGAAFGGIRNESPMSDRDGRLWQCWSADSIVSGQRIYLKEQIGGFDARQITRSQWRRM